MTPQERFIELYSLGVDGTLAILEVLAIDLIQIGPDDSAFVEVEAFWTWMGDTPLEKDFNEIEFDRQMLEHQHYTGAEGQQIDCWMEFL